ncbi:MAG: LysR family transcriptional regulator [Gammaproteobacteria bacterium]|jgi:DNA-binding transcriptional LysR family regulator
MPKNTPKTTLDQWRALQAVVEYGGYAQAAARLFRSQSTISYAIQKLQQQLGVELLQVQGRKAELTEAGQVLIRRSRHLVKDALELEQLAYSMSQGREAEIRFVVDAAFPSTLLMEALRNFAPRSGGTRVQLKEVVLSGADEELESGEADLLISASYPSDYLGDILYQVEFIAVAHTSHPLHQTGRVLAKKDLEREMQVVIRDSGIRHNIDMGWLGAEHRWTVTSMETAVAAVASGLGFAWLPRHFVQHKLESGELKPLPLREGQVYRANLYLVFGKPDNIGPATSELAAVLRQCVDDYSNL